MRSRVGVAGLFVLIGIAPALVEGVAEAQEPAPSAADTSAAAPLEAAPSPSSSGSRPRPVRPGGGSEARSPGFEMLGDGSTRLTVELSQTVTYDTKTAPNRLTYVLKNARMARRNDANPLVTVHFNTPVASARLVPHGRDLWFAVELRAAAKPTVTTDTAKDGGIVLRIDFAKGDYLPAASASDAPEPLAPAADDDSATATTTSASGAPDPASRSADRPKKSRSRH